MPVTQADLEVLAAFYAGLGPPCDLDDIRAGEPGPEVIDAAWRLFRHTFVLGPPPLPRAGMLTEVAALILGAVGGYGRQALDGLALGEVPAGRYVQLAPLLNTLTDADGELFCDVLAEAIEEGEPDRAERALYLLRAGYGVRFRFPASDDQVARLNEAVASRRAQGTDHPGLSGALAAYVPPAPR